MKRAKTTAVKSGRPAFEFDDQPKKTKLKPVKKAKKRKSFFDEDDDYFPNLDDEDSFTDLREEEDEEDNY